MSIELLDHVGDRPMGSGNELTDGLLKFPTFACAAGSACPNCSDCVNDCLDCEMCAADACEYCEIPDLTPRTANMLVIAGFALARHARAASVTSLRPVLLHHVARAFEETAATLERGARPWPRSMAEQLCLHLMISHARQLACGVGEAFAGGLPYSDYDYFFDRLYDTLLPDDKHAALVEAIERTSCDPGLVSVDALCDVLTADNVNALFTPFASR